MSIGKKYSFCGVLLGALFLAPSTGFCLSSESDLSYIFGHDNPSPSFTADKPLSWEMSADAAMIEKRLAQKYDSNETAVLTYTMKAGDTFIYSYASDKKDAGLRPKREQGICMGQEFGWNPMFSNGSAPTPSLGFWCLKTEMPQPSGQDAKDIAKLVYDEFGVAQFVTQKLEAGFDLPFGKFANFGEWDADFGDSLIGLHLEQVLNVTQSMYHSYRSMPIDTKVHRSGKIMLVYQLRW